MILAGVTGYFMTERVASYGVPGGFQHGQTSFPVITDESCLHEAVLDVQPASSCSVRSWEAGEGG